MGILALISLERIQKDGCSQQVGTPARRDMPGDQLTIEVIQPSASARMAVTSRRQNGCCSGLDHGQGLCAASIKYAGVVKSSHHREKRVQPADLLGTSRHSPLAQYRKAVLDHMREAARSFSSRACGAVARSRDVPVCD